MASRITAIRKYRPEIKRMNTMQTSGLVEVIAQRTNLNEGEIRENVYELRDAILMASRRGQAVKVEGLGTFTPTLRMDGSLDILFRPDARMLDQLNNTENFYAAILNKANIGKSAQDLIAQWNREHPDDPVNE